MVSGGLVVICREGNGGAAGGGRAGVSGGQRNADSSCEVLQRQRTGGDVQCQARIDVIRIDHAGADSRRAGRVVKLEEATDWIRIANDEAVEVPCAGFDIQARPGEDRYSAQSALARSTDLGKLPRGIRESSFPLVKCQRLYTRQDIVSSFLFELIFISEDLDATALLILRAERMGPF